PAERLQHRVDNAVAIRGVADVPATEKRGDTRAEQRLRLARGLLVAGVVDRERVAVTGQLDADTASDTATTAGHQGDGMRMHRQALRAWRCRYRSDWFVVREMTD